MDRKPDMSRITATMTKRKKNMLGVLAALVCAGIAHEAVGQGLTDLEMRGRYAELEKAAEQRLARQSQPDASLLGALCTAYSRVKRYKNLFDCLDRLDRQIKAGDWMLKTDKVLVSDSDATPMPNMLRAEALI